MEEPKVDKFEKDQIFFLSKNNKNDKDGASITPTRTIIGTVDKEGKLGEIVVKEANTYPISAKNKIDTVDKKEKSQTSKDTSDTSKNNKIDTVNTIYESRSTPRTNLSNKFFHIENPQK